LTPAIIERMYDERSGLFMPIARPQRPAPTPVTWSALAPLALPDLPDAIGRRLIDEHLLDAGRFWLPVPPSSVSAAESSFKPGETRLLGLRRYWRGPTWINAAWLVWLGLRRLGYHAQADDLAERISSTVLRAGLREYYNPYTGRGMGAVDFGWSTLALELADPDPRAESSYLNS
jgi:hypothetical protein